jgi:hypothetical protein
LLYNQNGCILAQVRINGSSQNVESATVTKNQWHHFVYRYDGENEVIFADGVKGTNYPKTGSLNSDVNDGIIGCGTSGYTYHFNGAIDEVRIYNRALSAEEIKWLYREPYCMFEEGELLL